MGICALGVTRQLDRSASDRRPSDQIYLPCYCLRRGAALGHGPAYATCRYVVVHFARNNRSAFRSDRERYCRRQYADLLAIRGLVAAMGDRGTGSMMRTGATTTLSNLHRATPWLWLHCSERAQR
jgi:hypothetical protein